MNTNSLVLLHGWGMNPGIWSTLPSTLAPACERTHLALPGHGGSPWHEHWNRLPDWADACLSRAPEQAVWLGWSLGGLVALEAARQAPKRIRALILVGTSPRFTQAADWRVAMPTETFDQFQASLLTDPSGTLQRFLTLQVRGSEQAPRSLKLLRHALDAHPSPQPQALDAGLRLLQDEDLRGPLPDITAPSLWIFGEKDTLVPAAVAERVGILLPQARVECIPGAGHAPFLSHPQQTTLLINDFLAEIAA